MCVNLSKESLVFTLVFGDGVGWFWSWFALSVARFSLLIIRPYLKQARVPLLIVYL